jgi:hypothetical protein
LPVAVIYSSDPGGVPRATSGMTHRVTGIPGTPRCEAHDTNAGVSTWAGTTFSIGSVSWVSFAVELVAAAAAPTGSGLLLAGHRNRLVRA